jgi:hypothetical protein
MPGCQWVDALMGAKAVQPRELGPLLQLTTRPGLFEGPGHNVAIGNQARRMFVIPQTKVWFCPMSRRRPLPSSAPVSARLSEQRLAKALPGFVKTAIPMPDVQGSSGSRRVHTTTARTMLKTRPDTAMGVSDAPLAAERALLPLPWMGLAGRAAVARLELQTCRLRL